MHEALTAMNRLVANGVIPDYAIGGAIGASFHIEAQATADIDIFFVLPESASGLLSLTSIYAACASLGGVVDGEYVRFGSWPVQLLPAYKPLVEEALVQALTVQFDGIPTRVFTAEHTCAIAMDTGRPKDYLRVSMFIEQQAVDIEALANLLHRYNLEGRCKHIHNWPGRDD